MISAYPNIATIVPRPHLVLVEILKLRGFTPSGIYLEHHERMPDIRARVIAAGDEARGLGVEPGSEIVFHRYAEEEVTLFDPAQGTDGTFAFINVQAIQAIVERNGPEGNTLP